MKIIKNNEICILAMRRFLERWRKTETKSVKHWFVTELGQNKTERVHMHGILFTNKDGEFISKKWKYGIITIGKRKYKNGKKLDEGNLGFVSEQTINYTIKYVSKSDEKHKTYEPRILCSKGIGKGYLNRTDSIRRQIS